MKQAGVLALDLATTTGWALHLPGMERPFFDAFTLPGDAQTVGEACSALEDWLEETYDTFASRGGISHYFFEEQHIAEGVSPRGVYRLIGLGATVEKFAFDNGGFCYSVPISSWRKHFLGRGSGFKRDKSYPGKKKPYLPGEDPKELAIIQCSRYGWHTNVHDAAEACGILDYACSMLPNYHRPWRDNLLLGGVR